MKKVALISDGWKRLITYAWVDGIMTAIRESGEEVCLHQYNCYGNWSRDKLHNQGEYNIYNLPELRKYDGIILDCNNIVDEKVLSGLISMLRKADVPVVSIGYEIEGFYYAGIDNRQPILDMMEHLYKIHGCRRFIFAGGPKDNYENSLRVQAYRDRLEEFGLKTAENPVLYGDYDYETGIVHLKKVIEEGWALPDVFVCANDNIAAGLCEAAEQLGYEIPGDFLVTGFDNLDKAAYFKPQITTVGHERERIGKKCMEILLDLWSGKKLEKHNFVPAECIFTESCGCPNNGMVDYREYVKNQIVYGVKKQEDEELLMELEGNIVNASTFEEIFERIGEYFAKLECDGFVTVLDKRLFEADVNTVFPTEGYDRDNLIVTHLFERDRKVCMHSLKDIYECMEQYGSSNAYMFTPIHFKNQAVGFSIMKNARFLYDNPYFYDIHSTIVKSLENLFKTRQMENVNRRLKDMYNRDPMTGLYNRIAYSEMIEPEYRGYCEKNVACAVAFLDVDKFKQINDTMGHEYGDMILKKIAVTLKELCPEGGYVYRFGGDEFVVFFPEASIEKNDEFRKKLIAKLREHEIEISIGMVLTSPDSGKRLDDYLAEADKKMYEAKMIKKQKV